MSKSKENMEQSFAIGDKVSVLFTEKLNDFAKGYLIDNENIKVVMNYTSIKKKKIKLNQEMELIIDNYDIKNKIISVIKEEEKKLTIPIKFFEGLTPSRNEIVQIMIDERDELSVRGHLIDYNCDMIMEYRNVSKKKKIRNINKLVPLNVIKYAVVEDYDESNNVTNVSMAYLDNDIDYKTKFKNNRKLIEMIYNLDIENFTNIWLNEILSLLLSKTTNLDEEDYYEFFNDNYLTSNINDEFKLLITNRLNELNTSNETTIKKSIKLLSPDGIKHIINLIDYVKQNEDYNNLTIKYDGCPNYLIEGETEDLINNFMEEMNFNKNQFSENIFIQS